MAKVRYGALAGQISGSVGSLTFSHNRGGAYVRNRSLCTKKTTDEAMAAKARFALESSAWADLSDAQRLSWASWAANYPITDTMGEKRILTGHQAFVAINCRLNLAGVVEIDLPPAAPAPDGLTTLSISADFSGATSALTFTPTPLPATCGLWMLGCILPHAGIEYVKNRLKFIGTSGLAETSTYAWQAQFEARCGVPTVGQIAVCWCHVADCSTGLISSPLSARVIVA